mgnify:CR=1 FL=1
MFIYSVKASSIKFFSILGLATVLLVIMIFALPTKPATAPEAAVISEATITYNKIKTESARTEFLKQFGWQRHFR